MKSIIRLALSAAAIVVGATCGGAAPGNEAIRLTAHRAIYDLKLERTRGKRPLEAVRGRIVYDFSGSTCEGYDLQFRQVTELDTGEGKVLFSDLRSTTWEQGGGQTYRFASQNIVDRDPAEQVEGNAQRRDDKVAVSLVKPQPKSFDFESAVVFPSEHIRRILVAAHAGQSLLQLPVFDGSENGEKLYKTLTVIGRQIAPDKTPNDAAAKEASLASMPRWPVTVSYFETDSSRGEQTPVYAITFELYENGISRALLLDYGDFVISGEMTTLEIRPDKSCP
jgi:hypothetical protein